MTNDKKISILIIDDEPLARFGLREILERDPEISIVGESEDGEQAIHDIQQLAPDVVLLDIQMPELTGFDVIQSIPPNIRPLIIFVTAYDEFAVKAFSERAIDYVLKPFDAERINSSLHRVKKIIRSKNTDAYTKSMIEVLRSIQVEKRYLKRIPIRQAGKITFVRVEDVFWIEAAADYIVISSRTGKYTTRESIGVIEHQLDPAKFVRIHRSSIVNLNCIKELQPMNHGDLIAVLENGTTLTVSRTYRNRLSSFLA